MSNKIWAGPAIFALVFLLGCGVVSITEELLNEAECEQLMDKIHEVLRVGLTGKDLEGFDADHEVGRAESVRNCVEDPVWGRRGFECLMAADDGGAMNRCILMNR